MKYSHILLAFMLIIVCVSDFGSQRYLKGTTTADVSPSSVQHIITSFSLFSHPCNNSNNIGSVCNWRVFADFAAAKSMSFTDTTLSNFDLAYGTPNGLKKDSENITKKESNLYSLSLVIENENNYSISLLDSVKNDSTTFEYEKNDKEVHKDGLWAFVPAGEFTWGQFDEIISINYDYEIMKYEVTLLQYLTYLEEAYLAGEIWINGSEVTGYYEGDENFQAGDYWFYALGIGQSSYKYGQISFDGTSFIINVPAGYSQGDFDSHPLTQVTWFGANAFAKHYGWRIPTEVEWEKAARGMTGYEYPWGNSLSSDRANFLSSGDPFEIGTTPVGFYNGQVYKGFQTTDSPSPYGCYDMCGNVSELTDTWYNYSAKYVKDSPYWVSGSYNGFRSWYHSPSGQPSAGISRGFRCVRDFKALFNAIPTQGISPLIVQFFDLSFCYPSSWQWDFENDGVIDSFEQNPIWEYTESGVYTVSLIITSNLTTDTIVKEQYILVLEGAKIIVDPLSQSLCDGLFVSLHLTTNGDSLQYQWQKDEDNIAGANDSILLFENVQQSDEGNYRCIVSNLLSADTSAIAQLTVYPLPEVNLGSDTAICIGTTITFDAGVGYDSYLWNDSSTLQTLTTNVAGKYWVEVTNSFGCAKTDTINLLIGMPPIADFSFNQICNDYLVTFTDQSTIAKNTITSWYWDFGDPLSNQDTSSAQNPSYSYSSPSMYDVYLRVSTNDGCFGEINQSVVIHDFLQVDIGADFTSCQGNTIQIVPLVTGGATPYSYLWSISNGTNSTDSVLNLTINSNLNVILQITDSNGCQVSDEVNISITQVFQDEEICLVTVDNATGKNMIVWEKTPGVGTVSYNIYRDYSDNLIASVPYDEISIYIDNSSQPEIKRNTYWLSAVDSCGNESSLSNSHITMLLSISMAYPSGILLSWNDYLGFGYDKFYIYKQASTGNLTLIDSLPNDLFLQNYYMNIPNPLENVIYRIAVKKTEACNPVGSKAGPFKQSQSNIADNIVQTLSMQQGWNGVSLSIIPDCPNIEFIFDPILNKLIIVKDLNELYWPELGINTIVNWDNSTGYSVKLNTADTLEIIGEFISPTEITLYPGWHYLPVLNRCVTSTTELFGNQNENIIIVQDLIGSNVYWPEMNITTLTTVEPGKAYKIKVRNAFTLTFPSCDSKSYSVSSPSPNSITTSQGELKINPFKHLLAFKDYSITDFVFEGDQIGAFTQDNVLSGFLTVGNLKSNNTITLYADDPTTPDCDGYKEGEALNFRLFRPGTEETFDLDVEYDPNFDNDGTFKTNGISVISRVKQSALAMNEVGTGTIRIYPNPTEGMVVLTFNGLKEQATIRVSDLQNKDYIQFEIDGADQEQKRKLDLSALAPGVYLITVTGETFSFVKKIIVM